MSSRLGRSCCQRCRTQNGVSQLLMVLAETPETPGQQMGKLIQNGVSQLSVELAETPETPRRHVEPGCRMGSPSCLWCWLPASTPWQHSLLHSGRDLCRMGSPSCLWCWLPAFDTPGSQPVQNEVSRLPAVCKRRLLMTLDCTYAFKMLLTLNLRLPDVRPYGCLSAFACALVDTSYHYRGR